LVLSALGVAFIWSASQGAIGIHKKPVMQALFLAASLPFVLCLLRLGYTVLARYAYSIYGVLLLSLVLVLAMGGGRSARWFNLAIGISVQPSEFMKIGVCIALARYLMYRKSLDTWRALVPPFVMAGLPMALIIKQPDLGTALVLVPVTFGMLYAAGVSGRRLLVIVFAGIITLPLVYHLPLLKDYQRERIKSYLTSLPDLDAKAKALQKEGDRVAAARVKAEIDRLKRGAGFQRFHAMVSIGSGGLLGKGFAQGPQNRLDHLPARHTDFIFAVVGEEWGLMGCSAILLLFFLLVAIILGIARRTREPFGRHLCTGVALLFMTQAFINTGISVGLLPITGLTLPFVSYGGSSLLSSYLALAMVLDVGVRRVRMLGPSR
jgi:rod shape determining protein RodA